MVSVELSAALPDLEQIVRLQRKYHSSAVDAAEWASDGFVTLEYSVPKLQQIAGPYRHVVAKAGPEVVGYALVMVPECRGLFPILDDMFAAIDASAMARRRYFVMGQVCVDKAWRGQGLFRAMYATLREQMHADFELCITEVSTRNIRSVRAHRQIGFEVIAEASSEQWQIISLEMRSPG